MVYRKLLVVVIYLWLIPILLSVRIRVCQDPLILTHKNILGATKICFGSVSTTRVADSYKTNKSQKDTKLQHYMFQTSKCYLTTFKFRKLTKWTTEYILKAAKYAIINVSTWYGVHLSSQKCISLHFIAMGWNLLNLCPILVAKVM